MKSILKLLILSISVFLARCDKNEVPVREYPTLNTLKVSNISEDGATITAEITNPKGVEILFYGFVWAEYNDPTLEVSDRVVYSGNINSARFSGQISSSMKRGTLYYVKPFLKTEGYTVYGKATKFISLGSLPPIITNFYPNTGCVTDTVTIVGENFSYLISSNMVQFTNESSSVVYASDSLLRVIVPENLSSDLASLCIKVADRVAMAGNKFILKKPILISSDKANINICDTILFEIKNVGPNSLPKIFFNNTPAKILTKGNDQIKVIVPFLSTEVPDIQTKLVIGSMESHLPYSLNLAPPIVTAVEPAYFSFLDTITLYYVNMPNCQLDIFIDGRQVSIIESTALYAKVAVPGSINRPWGDILVQAFLNGKLLYSKIYPRILRIDSISPSFGNPGDTVTIKGLGFHPVLNNNIVCFTCNASSYGAHGIIISGNTHELKVIIPDTYPNKIGVSVFSQNISTFNFPFEVR
jgi:hypothetical protein